MSCVSSVLPWSYHVVGSDICAGVGVTSNTPSLIDKARGSKKFETSFLRSSLTLLRNRSTHDAEIRKWIICLLEMSVKRSPAEAFPGEEAIFCRS